MRIFYASGERPNQALANSRVWRNNLYLALVDLGHNVVEFDYDLNPLIRHADIKVPANRAFVSEHRPRAEAVLMEQIGRAHDAAPLDLFFSYFYSACAGPQTIRRIRTLGIPAMNWYCNGSYQFDLVEEIAPAYDWSLVPEAFRLDDYRSAGANPIYCQEAANPLVYHPVDVPRDLDVVFVGARYGDRAVHIRRLVDAGVPVRVFGPGWLKARSKPRAVVPAAATSRRGTIQRLRQLGTRDGWRRLARRLRRLIGRPAREPSRRPTAGDAPALLPARAAEEPTLPPEILGPPLSDGEMVDMYSRAKISLGFSSVGDTARGPQRIVQVRLRDFEAPMSGAFYLVEDIPELRAFFEIGAEIATYSGPDDLVTKCRYYLANEDEREAVRTAGHRRALADHTWQRRLGTVFDSVGLPFDRGRTSRAAATKAR